MPHLKPCREPVCFGSLQSNSHCGTSGPLWIPSVFPHLQSRFLGGRKWLPNTAKKVSILPNCKLTSDVHSADCELASGRWARERAGDAAAKVKGVRGRRALHAEHLHTKNNPTECHARGNDLNIPASACDAVQSELCSILHCEGDQPMIGWQALCKNSLNQHPPSGPHVLVLKPPAGE